MDFYELWQNPFAMGGLADYIKNLTPVETLEDFDLVKLELDGIFDILKNNQHLITDDVLDALANKGMGDPALYADHIDRDHTIPAQKMSLYIIRCLQELSSSMGNQDQRITGKIESVAEHSPDLNVKRQAIISLRAVSSVGEKINLHGIEALHRQSLKNSHPAMRTRARRSLLEIGKNHEEASGYALSALEHGMEDKDDTARGIAVSLMINRVRSPNCSIAEVREIKDLFEKVATQNADNPAIRSYAWGGQAAANDRLETGRTGPVFP